MCVKTRKVFSGIKKRKTHSLWERVIFAFVGKTTFLESSFLELTKHGKAWKLETRP
jgi:hypothetical protein